MAYYENLLEVQQYTRQQLRNNLKQAARLKPKGNKPGMAVADKLPATMSAAIR
jgi:hypothetical protein